MRKNDHYGKHQPYKAFKFPKIEAIDAAHSREQEVSYSLIDFNHHLNANHYFRLTYDALPTALIAQHYPVKYHAKFEHETMSFKTHQFAIST